MNRAIILIDEDETDGGVWTAECIEQSERHGYGFVALMRDVDRALDLLRRRIVSAVIFPGRTRQCVQERELEPAVDETAILTIEVPAPRAVGRRSVPLTPEWVRELIDTDTAVAATTATVRDVGLMETLGLVTAYREGYADGFVDSLTLNRMQPRSS